MQYRESFIFAVITLIILFVWQEPLILGIGSFTLVLGYLLIIKGLIPHLDRLDHTLDQENRRKLALKSAKSFLTPYKSIWKDLKLSNKFCYLTLDSDGVSISAKEKNYPYRKFKVISSQVHEYTDLWNMFCTNFNHCKTYDDLVDDCRLYELTIYEYATKHETPKKDNAQILPSQIIQEKLDINNCSEIELTELPGISIVMAKKAIKKREEIGGFKTVEDFFNFMKLKSHMEIQLRERICVKKMKGVGKKIKRNNERSVDL